jgi:hypothetical protein
MNTDTISTIGTLAVDWEHGLIIRADDQAEVTQKWVELHPFVSYDELGRIIAGRGSKRVVYEIQRQLGNLLTLQRIKEV